MPHAYQREAMFLFKSTFFCSGFGGGPEMAISQSDLCRIMSGLHHAQNLPGKCHFMESKEVDSFFNSMPDLQTHGIVECSYWDNFGGPPLPPPGDADSYLQMWKGVGWMQAFDRIKWVTQWKQVKRSDIVTFDEIFSVLMTFSSRHRPFKLMFKTYGGYCFRSVLCFSFTIFDWQVHMVLLLLTNRLVRDRVRRLVVLLSLWLTRDLFSRINAKCRIYWTKKML